MNKIIKWISKHYILFILFIGVIIFLPIVVISILLIINIGCKRLVVEWVPGNALLYWGSCLSFIGSIALGIIAVYQNLQAQKTNDKI